MAVFTPVTEADARFFLGAYDLGELKALEAIAEGIQNTNYRVETDKERLVLTLFEERTDADVLPFCLGLTAHLAARGFPVSVRRRKSAPPAHHAGAKSPRKRA